MSSNIIIDNLVVNIERKKVKHLRLAVYSTENRIRISAPLRMKDEMIQSFIVSKMPWIKKHLSKFAAYPKQPLSVIEPWQKKQLHENIGILVQKYEKIMGVSVSEFRIKKMKTRWGTCNTRARRIWINLELVRKSLDCLEYIVVHEMVHLLERSHNARFKAFMDTYLPDWRVSKQELKHSLLEQV